LHVKRPLAASQAACPASFEQGRDVAASMYPVVHEDGKAEGQAEARGQIAGWLLELGATDLAIKLLNYEDEGERVPMPLGPSPMQAELRGG
jgi:hypothetical protein